jgi:hypothetical protein
VTDVEVRGRPAHNFYTRQNEQSRLMCLGCGSVQSSNWDRTVARWYCNYCGSTIVCPECSSPIASNDGRCAERHTKGAAPSTLVLTS